MLATIFNYILILSRVTKSVTKPTSPPINIGFECMSEEEDTGIVGQWERISDRL